MTRIWQVTSKVWSYQGGSK